MGERLEKLASELTKRMLDKKLADGQPIVLPKTADDYEEPFGIMFGVERKHPQRADKKWLRWIIFMYDRTEDCMWAHYGETIRHTRTKYPECIRDLEELDYCLKYFTDPPGSMVLISTKEKK
jgi:hypothetical protein